MPIYGYRCTQCGHEFEVLQSMSEPPRHECPNCMGPLQKMLYPVGVIYKGTGFYTTDYKSGARSGSKSESDGAKPDSKNPKKESGGSTEKSSEKAAS